MNIFLHVCDERNMTAAAEKLRITQPSVSQAIAELEDHYKVKLFERLGRKLFITMAGQKLLEYARHIVNLNREVEDAMREISRKGVIRIGASVTVGSYLLSGLMNEFETIHPAVRIVSAVHNTKIIEGMLLQDQLDIGLVEGRVHSSGLIAKPFMQDELVLVCGVAHPLFRRSKVSPSQLENMEFVVREEGSGTRELFEAVMESCGIGWQIHGVYNNVEMIKNAVSTGRALSVMSSLTIMEEVNAGILFAIDVDGMKFRRQFSIVYHKNKYLSSTLCQLIQMCQDFAPKNFAGKKRMDEEIN